MSDGASTPLPHVIYYVASSLDGRIAGPADSLDFLDALDDPEGYGGDAFEPFFGTVDALVMGGRTFAVIREAIASGASDGWPYGDRRSIVMTHDERPVAIAGAEIESFAGSPRELTDALDASGAARVWLVGGGGLAGAFFADDLVDEIVLTLVPTVLGAGAALADRPDLPLRDFALSGATRGANSVALRYQRRR